MLRFYLSIYLDNMFVSRETVSSWGSLCKRLSASSYYRHIFKNNKPSILKGCVPGFVSLLFSAKTQQDKQGFVIIAEQGPDAEKVFLDINDLVSRKVCFAPEIDQNDHGPALFVSEEEKSFDSAYAAAVSNERPIIITSLSALLRLVRKPGHSGSGVLLKNGGVVSLGGVVNTLMRWGYESVDSTVAPRSFTVRGGIIDIFPLYATRPVRVEFYGNEIESIRQFNPVSQLSISKMGAVELLAPSGYGSEDKIVFEELLKSSLSHFYYLKNNATSYTIANNADCGGARLEVDCLPGNLTGLVNGSSQNVIIFGSNHLYQKKLKKTLKNFSVVKKPLRSGFISKRLNVAVFGYDDLHLLRPVFSDTLTTAPERPAVFGLANIELGDYVVHEDYGVGIYRGLSFLGGSANQQDGITIEFANGGIVKVALGRFDKIHKHVSSGRGFVKLSHLGSAAWQNQLARVKKSVVSIVEDLIKIYSYRHQPRGYSYVSDDEFLDMLAASFAFDETPDQQAAIKDVLCDLDKISPMDRVILGDVGFGKTEVALRGAMKVIAGGKQVFFLAPTTVLSDQHFITAKNRFGELGVKIELLSRFRSKKEQLSVLDKIKRNQTDLVIGTHRLLSDDIVTDGLGLLIIDEEHRFGVKDKERIRLLKKDVDVLTLTATPIPRTLQQSLVGVRDISRIDTPPKERLPIKTTVQYFSWKAIKLQINREVSRGGQVYFLHNDIQSLPFMVEKIKNLFPRFVISGAHGSMSSKKLEDTILSFFSGGIDVLVCTTIIESGLDVTNANTVIINNAHRFGLAQLYQVRGRVGRGSVQAYCWLLIPKKTLNENAYRRLRAIEHSSALGSGYQIAIKDLEIRGAGSLFGYEQSGHINRIGYDMYCKILKDGVDERLGATKDRARPVISFQGATYFPPSYMPLDQDRVYYYQRLSVARGLDEVTAVRNEIIDRFGRLPDESKNVVSVAKIRELFVGCGVKKISLKNKSAAIYFSEIQEKNTFSLNRLQKLFSSTKRTFQFNNNGGFAAFIDMSSLDDALSFAAHFAELMRADISA